MNSNRIKINFLGKQLLVLVLFFFLFAISTSVAQVNSSNAKDRKNRAAQEEIEEAKQQAQNSDTTKFVMDTVGLSTPIKTHTRIFLNDFSPYREISKKDIVFDTYYTISDILSRKHIGYPSSLGFPGFQNSNIIAGNFPSGLNVRLGDNNFNSFETGLSNLSLLPAEEFENIEILIGSDAVINGTNSTGSLINFQEINRNSYKPYTKLWYSQGSSDMIAADGIFSQNFAKNFNLDLGFRSMNSPGLYKNQSINSWNLRAKVRWNPDNLTSITLSEYFNNYGVGENGGMNTSVSTSIFDEIAAYPLFDNMNSRLFQHNLNLNVSKFLDSSKYFAVTSKTSLIYSNKEILDGNHLLSKPSDSLNYVKYSTYTFSNKSTIETSISFFNLVAGEEIYFDKIRNLDSIEIAPIENADYLNFALFAETHLNFWDIFELSGGARYSRQFDKNSLSLGAKLKINFDSSNTMFFDISKSDRIPSLFEGKNLEPEHHYLILAGTNLQLFGVKIDLLGFVRQVDLPVIFSFNYDSLSSSYKTNFSNGSNQRIFGLESNFNFEPVNHLFIETFIKTYFTQQNSQTLNMLPNLYSGLKSFYSIEIGQSIMRLGAEYEFLISKGGESYFPIYSTYYNIGTDSKFMGNGLNLFAEARLNDAYIRIMLKNALGQGYYYEPYYPELGRHFQFSFSWAFFD